MGKKKPATVFKTVAGFLILVLFLITQGQSAPFLPNDLCRRLEPTTDASAFQTASREYPGLKSENLRTLPEEKLLDFLEWASQKNISALELFTDSAFNDSECVIYVEGKTLWKINKGYELYLISPIVGRDTKGNLFYVTHFFGGMGVINIVFNRNQTVFNHPIYDNRFELDHVLRHKIARFGRLELKGIRALVNIVFGTLRYNIDSLTILEGRKLEVDAEGHKELHRLLPITKRQALKRKRRMLRPSLPGMTPQSKPRPVRIPH